jgi:acyl-CoA synthetase (AMP-forming)/AMP-acid ligase II
MGKGYLNKDGEIDIFPTSGFRTGDLGYIDSEGYIFLTGRRKDLIIRGGINISPVEITDRILDHPCIEEAVTFGIPDEIYGEEIACFVVPKPNCNVKVSDIMTHCKNTLPPFKVPKILKLVKEIPRTQRGKVIRQALLKGTQEYEL